MVYEIPSKIKTLDSSKEESSVFYLIISALIESRMNLMSNHSSYFFTITVAL